MSTPLIAYRVAPQMEFKAARELDQHGIRYELPTEQITTRRTGSRKPVVRTSPLMRGYLPAVSKPYNAKHIKSAVGIVQEVEIIRLKATMDRIQKRQQGNRTRNPYRIGQHVRVGEVPAVIATTNGSEVTIAFEMGGKQHVQTMHYDRIRPG